MLFQLFQTDSIQMALISVLLTVPTVLIALSLHEAAHAFVAYKCGDPTARNLGRLTMNPFKHLDPIGTLCMLIFGYGWAKPVPVNSRYFKKPKKGMALTALAGPVMNLLLGFIGVTFYALFFRLLERHARNVFLEAAVLFFFNFFRLNILYAVFNLIPIPPFDGSRVAFVFLPDKFYYGVMKYERILMIVVLIGFATGLFWTPVDLIAGLIQKGMLSLISLIF